MPWSANRVPGVLEVLGRLQQRLRRNAADVGAGASRRGLAAGARPIVDAGRPEPELRAANRGDVAAGPAPITTTSKRSVSPSRASEIEQQARRIFERFLDRDERQHRFAAVDDPVIVAIARGS